MTDQNEQNQKSECCGGKCGEAHEQNHACGCLHSLEQITVTKQPNGDVIIQ